MFGLLRRKAVSAALLAVCPTEQAISIARVRREKNGSPVLELSHVEELESLSLAGAELARLARSHGLGANVCVSTLDLGVYALLFVEAPDVPPAELRAAIRWRVKDLIDFHIDDAVIDVFEVPNQKSVANTKMMYAVVARSETVRQQIDLLSTSGMQLEVMDIPEMALRNVAALLPEDVAGVAMLYLDRRRGLITLTRQSTLYLSRRLDIGSDKLGQDFETAEPKLDRIIVELQRSLDYYESHFAQPAIGNVVIAPLPVPIPGMDQYLTDQLGLTVRSMNINELIDIDEGVESVDTRSLLAIGAALRVEEKLL